jgi:type IV pilus assembly protein PilY1
MSCVNLQTDSNYCGSCNNVCTGGKTCVSGTCKCPAGTTDCGGKCVELSNDENHCGACNNNCVTKFGESGVCCSGSCKDTNVDNANCGSCGKACDTAAGKTCDQGDCICPYPTIDCGGKCINPDKDAANCGGCGINCGPGGACCEGLCYNLQTDSNNCGACGTVCTGGKTCQSGSCKCPAGLSDCGGTCQNLQEDEANCGACNNKCTSDRSCVKGVCTCNSPTIDCNGVCRNPTNDNNNCGGCDIQCTGGMTCVSSVCKCPFGTTDCNGVCVNTSTDRNNCGSCGNVCRDSKMVCSDGTCSCTNTCNAPYVLNAFSCDCQCKVSCPGGQVVNAETCACESGTCKQKITSDRQTTFAAENFAELDSVKIVGGALQLQTDAIKLVADKIKLNKAQDLSAVYVQDSGSSTQAIGYLYYDDLIKRGYIDTRGTSDTGDDALHDKNSNGIADFHEDLFNLAPRSGTDSRPYVGRTPRCSATFTHDGKTYSAPELGMQGCNVNFYTAGAAYQPKSAGAAGCGTAYNTSCLRDARVGRWGSGIRTSQVGADVAPPTWNTGIYSDNGLFPTIPNLLEPPVDENLGKGLGNVLFIITDDDGNTATNSAGFGTGTFTRLDGTTFSVSDGSTTVNGVPDYDGSAFEASGEPLDPADNLDPGITANDADRQRDMGTIPGGKEIVFFQVGYGRPAHNSSGSGTMSYPCLKFASDGHCTLHMAGPVNVSFSKPFLNLDMNPLSTDPIMVRNAGCSNATNCTITQGALYRNSNRTGWLTGATLTRLNTQPYGWQTLPRDAVVVNRHVPAIGAPKIPHVVAYSPVTDPFRWFLGFEDLTRADSSRDYNDVVIIINKANGGEARSEVMTKDIAAGLENEFSVTKVRFRRDDDKYRKELGTGKWTETDTNACLGPPEADITYSIALDCRVCQGSTGNCSFNENPTWYDLEWTNGQSEMTLDMAEVGLIGSQLCWKVSIDSPRDECVPRIYNVDVGYEALRAGEYSRSQLIPLANVITYGTFEQAGPGWNGDIAPKPSRRTYTNREDVTVRGHLWMNQVYDPADPKKTAAKSLWDAGNVLAKYVGGTTNPDGRSLYTMSTTGTRMSLGTEITSGTRAFPTSIYTARIGTQYVYDLNQSHSLRTRANQSDRTFFRDWLYGWEDRSGLAGSVYDDCIKNGDCYKQANARRAWPLGGLRLSTPAVVTPPMTPPWMKRASSSEQSQFSSNFQSKLSGRSTVSYVGAMDGMLHAFAAGQYRNSDDPCTGFVDYRGYFRGNTCNARDYGTGSELFAYAPAQLLPRYLRMYVPGARVTTGTTITRTGALPKQQATVDATASFADMDFGITGQPAWTIDTTGSRTAGAKTVLAMATGPALNTVFALDVTDPSSATYPLPLWEAALGFQSTGEFTNLSQWNGATPKPVLWPTSTGTRHSPTMVRAAVGSNVGRKWLTIFPTDYSPSSASYAGTVYLFDTQTGRLLADGSRVVGIVPLEKGEGVAGEVVGADVNGDGDYDVLYAASTSGKIFRINLGDLQPNRAPDRRFNVCVVADAAATLSSKGLAAAQAALQDVYSPPAINVLRDGTPRVRIFFGSGNNPDSALDTQATNYFLFGYEDTSPLSNACSAAKSLWTYKLDAGQNVWGGVSLNSDSVFAITATGNGADACNLGTAEGKFYSVKQSADANGNAVVNVGSGMNIGGQGVAGGVIYDEQIMYTTATGEVKLVGSGVFNNDPASGTSGTRRTLRWEALPNGRMPK